VAVKAGGEVDSWCTKCKMDLLHRVVAIVAGAPKRVECQTCHSQHNYRAPKKIKEPGGTNGAAKSSTRSATKKSTAKPARVTKHEHEWEALVNGKTQGAFRSYSIQARFEPRELIRHKTFGEGCVLEVLQDQKINVIFREGCKVLVHGRA
jgi:hypothetical protein